MSRGRMSKADLQSRIYKLKTQIYNGSHDDQSDEWHEGAHYMLNKVLEFMEEFRL